MMIHIISRGIIFDYFIRCVINDITDHPRLNNEQQSVKSSKVEYDLKSIVKEYQKHIVVELQQVNHSNTSVLIITPIAE